jgi:methanogenic corrinoid protein MtbC1
VEAEADYWAAVAAADRPRAQRTVEALLEAGWGNDRVVAELIVPSQERVGDLWLRGEWSVAREHAATGVNEAVVHWLTARLPPPAPDAEVVLVSCLQGERHALPALIVAEGLAARGLRVVFLGADPEPSGLLLEILSLRPRAVLFSASLTSTLSAQKMFFHSVAAVGIPLVVGGRAFGGRELGERRARALGATAYAETVDEVVELLGRLPARTPAPEQPVGHIGDEDAVWLDHYRSEIAPDVMRVLALRHLEVDALAVQWPEVAQHVEHLLGCLAAAIVTRDESIMVEVRDWLASVLTHRGLDAALVDEIWELLAEPLRGHPIARVFLASSRPATRPAPERVS